MEPTFYEDQSYAGVGKESLRNMKRRLTLDFDALQPAKRGRASALLSSPDLNMLKLASPELEKLIIQHNGSVTTTPTPTQFIFPKNVTEEQESYAEGFAIALREIRAANSASSSSSLPDLQLPSAGTPMVTSYDGFLSSALSGASFPSVGSASSPSSDGASLMPLHIKEEPQTVPSLGFTPPLSPINMASQEKIKLERKRQRNRVAASKCRKRKLERIARLEDKVKDLKGENGHLGTMLHKLRDQVCLLKEQVMEHVNCGCQMLAPDF